MMSGLYRARQPNKLHSSESALKTNMSEGSERSTRCPARKDTCREPQDQSKNRNSITSSSSTAPRRRTPWTRCRCPRGRRRRGEPTTGRGGCCFQNKSLTGAVIPSSTGKRKCPRRSQRAHGPRGVRMSERHRESAVSLFVFVASSPPVLLGFGINTRVMFLCNRACLSVSRALESRVWECQSSAAGYWNFRTIHNEFLKRHQTGCM